MKFKIKKTLISSVFVILITAITAGFLSLILPTQWVDALTSKYKAVRMEATTGMILNSVEIGDWSEAAGFQVKVTSDDTTENYLLSKVVGSANITTTETNGGSNETLVLSVTSASIGTVELTDDEVTLAKMAGGTADRVFVMDGSGDPALELIDFDNMAAQTQGDIVIYEASGVPNNLAAATDGQVLTTKGSGANAIWADPSKCEYFTSSGTWTHNSSLSEVYLIVAGSGGGGGGASGGGGGGGGGGEVVYLIAAVSSNVTVTIGAAGSGGASGSNNGGTGGTTSFGSVTAIGGGGGASSGTGGIGGTGGSDGSGSTLIRRLPGNDGDSVGVGFIGGSGGFAAYPVDRATQSPAEDNGVTLGSGTVGIAMGQGGGGGGSNVNVAGGAGRTGMITVCDI